MADAEWRIPRMTAVYEPMPPPMSEDGEKWRLRDPVAGAAHGQDQVRRLIAKSLPQRGEVRLDRPALRTGRVAPHFAEQLVARHHPPPMPQQGRQQVELLRPQCENLAPSPDLPRIEVDRKRTERNHSARGRRWCSATQQRTHAREDLE